MRLLDKHSHCNSLQGEMVLDWTNASPIAQTLRFWMQRMKEHNFCKILAKSCFHLSLWQSLLLFIICFLNWFHTISTNINVISSKSNFLLSMRSSYYQKIILTSPSYLSRCVPLSFVKRTVEINPLWGNPLWEIFLTMLPLRHTRKEYQNYFCCFRNILTENLPWK